MDIQLLRAHMPKEGFSDLRYQHYEMTSIKGNQRAIDTVSVVRKSGGNVRVMTGGGFGTYCFTDLNDVATAFKEAKIASDLIPGSKVLSAAEANKAVVKVASENDPRQLPIEAKKAVIQAYMDQFMDCPEIAALETEYYEQFADTLILNSLGAEVRQEELICGLNFRITAKRGDVSQITRLSFGGSDDFSLICNQEQAVAEKIKISVALLDAEPVVGGNYDVVLDSDVSGLFIHEAFGHLSESDNLLTNEALAKTMTLGTVFATPELSVIDDPHLKGHPGSYTYDHEGTLAKRTYLIKDGALAGRLHGIESASQLGETATGHARAKHFGFTPIVRMGNIYIDKGKSTLESMIASIDNGLYLFGSAGGQTSGDTFTFAVQGAYKIENGQLKGLVRDVALTGHLFTTLKQIEMVGDTVSFSKVGGCGKGGQILIQSGKGSAPIKIKQMGIGGK